MIELTIGELSLVAGGDAGLTITADDAGTSSFSGTFFSQPNGSSGISLSVDGVGDTNGEFEVSFNLFADTTSLD